MDENNEIMEGAIDGRSLRLRKDGRMTQAVARREY